MKYSITLLTTLLLASFAALHAADPVNIGTRRELFVDDALVEKMSGRAELRLHHPVPREVVQEHSAPWEGSGSGYQSIFKDADIYRMYYGGWQLSVTPIESAYKSHEGFTCYAESDDGIHWRKPPLGLHDFQGSKANNIVVAGGPEFQNIDVAHPAVFKDENPNATTDAKYKAFFPRFRLRHPKLSTGLIPLKSPDGIHWSLMSETPVITDGGFDSVNVWFWDSVRGEYRAYWRFFPEGKETERPIDLYKGTRAIRTATSKDFIHWQNQAAVKYVDSPVEELYTSQVRPYPRAPHILVGFPTRYIEREWSESMRALPELEHRKLRAQASKGEHRERFGLALTESLFMASRDGETFKRWNEAFLPPGIERKGTWNYGQTYISWGLVETKSDLEGAPKELSFYATESYWTGNSNRLRRYTLRLDGFVSLYASMKGGELVTRPIRFQGDQLELNFATSAAGSVQVEIQDLDGKALPGFTLEECPPHFGDTIARTVSWKQGPAVESLANRPVRLRFVVRDAHVYAFRFVPGH
jgi:hypothetical protein